MLALEMASPGNRHCANCIGTLSFPTGSASVRCSAEDKDAMRANKTGSGGGCDHLIKFISSLTILFL